MNSDKRHEFGFNEIATPIFAISLWNLTIWLLGLPDPMPPGFKGKVGSSIVLLGCFVLARPMVSMLALLFRRKAAISPSPRVEDGFADGEPMVAQAHARSALFRPAVVRSRLER